MCRVLLVEDDPQIREGIQDFFSGRSQNMQVHSARTGSEGLRMVREGKYDIVLLDVMLPELNGFALLKEIRRNMDVPVIFLTARTREEERLYGYELGCDDYVCKPFSLAELYAKVMALIKRSKGDALRESLTCGAIVLDKRRMTVSVSGREIELAAKEYLLLKNLMERKGWVFSRELLLDKIWGADFMGSDRVVDNHVKKLRKALGEAGGQIRTVISHGYKITDRQVEGDGS